MVTVWRATCQLPHMGGLFFLSPLPHHRMWYYYCFRVALQKTEAQIRWFTQSLMANKQQGWDLNLCAPKPESEYLLPSFLSGIERVSRVWVIRQNGPWKLQIANKVCPCITLIFIGSFLPISPVFLFQPTCPRFKSSRFPRNLVLWQKSAVHGTEQARNQPWRSKKNMDQS